MNRDDWDSCPHLWLANWGKGGEPEFVPYSCVSLEYSRVETMAAMCDRCGRVAFFTRRAWWRTVEVGEVGEVGRSATTPAAWRPSQ